MNLIKSVLMLGAFTAAVFLPGCQESVETERARPSIKEACDPVREGAFVIDGAEAVARRVAEANAIINEHLQMADMARELCSKISRRIDAEDNPGVIHGRVGKGDTIAGLLDEADNSGNYVNAAARVFPLRSFRAGQPYTVVKDEDTGRIRRFEYEVNDKSRLVVEGDEAPKARLEDIEYSTSLTVCEGVINDSLFQAVADMGEGPQLALRLVDLFGSEINFIRDIQDGDSFAVLVEKRYREGGYRGYGRILAARFINRGKSWEAWLYRDQEGRLQHYNSRGENLKKTLLMAPLAVTRLTSRFTHARRHPILGRTRPHLGVDYGAPTGTPVKAVGHGTVTKKGWAGGYGNQIILRHNAGLESMYAHLSGFARGLKSGQKVRQGQVIGFVGSTGLATGPHLDFRLRQNGEFINPAKAINPRGAPVPPGLMASFKKVMELEKGYLDGKALPDKYALDSIVPAVVSLAGSKAVKADVVAGKAGKASRLSRGRVSHSKVGRASRLDRGQKGIKASKRARSGRNGARSPRKPRKKTGR